MANLSTPGSRMGDTLGEGARVKESPAARFARLTALTSADDQAFIAAYARQTALAASAEERAANSWKRATDDLNAETLVLLAFPSADTRAVPLPLRSGPLSGADFRPAFRLTIRDVRSLIEIQIDRLDGRTEITDGIEKSAAGVRKLAVKSLRMLLRDGMYSAHPEFVSALHRYLHAQLAWATQADNRPFVGQARAARAEVMEEATAYEDLGALMASVQGGDPGVAPSGMDTGTVAEPV